MKLFLALSILITLQLCLIRASGVEEQNVEDQNVEVAEDYSDLDYSDIDTSDLRARPRKRPFCERTRRPGRGLGGQCLLLPQLVNKSCDFIRREIRGVKYLCNDPPKYEQVCCGNCNAPVLNRSCHDKAGDDTASRQFCCPGEFARGLLNVGCRCCGPCKSRRRRCRSNRRYIRYCVAKYDEVKNYQYCTDNGGRIKRRRCLGKNCKCCVIPRLT